MCIPLWEFFIAVRDFKRSVREVKTNLIDMKSILNGTLSMSKELEAVTSEFKNVTEFYSEESKNALRNQLCSTLSTTAQEAFCHRDFLKQFKLTLDVEVCRLIEDYDKKTSQLAVLDIIQHLKRTIKQWMRVFRDDKLKTDLLVELTLYMQKLFSKNLSDWDVLPDKENVKKTKTNIKIFCEKQYLVELMESLLSDHFSRDITESDCFSDRYSKLQDLVYRKRATRIRRFRQFLTSKIQIKKIGKLYKEEISLQVSMDLKKASKEIWYHEGLMREQCSDLVKCLRALPRHRFVDVLEEDNFIDLAQRLTNIKLKPILEETIQSHGGDALLLSNFKSLLPKTRELFSVNFPQTTDCLRENASRILKSHEEHLHGEDGVSEQEFFFTMENRNAEEINSGACCSKTATNLMDNIEIERTDAKKCSTANSMQVGENSVIPSIVRPLIENEEFLLDFIVRLLDVFRNRSVGNLFSRDRQLPKSGDSSRSDTLSDKGPTENPATATTDHSDATEQKVIIDPEMIYDDIEKVTWKLLQVVGQKSARYTIELIDRSQVVSSKIIDFLSNMHALYLFDLTEETYENIFVEKIIEIFAMDLSREELNVLKNIIFAFSNNKQNRLLFLDRLERNLSLVLSKHVQTSKTIE